MVEHGSISRAHVYDMLRSKDIRVRRAAFTLLEASNPRLRRDSALFMEIVQFIWDANPSYDVYQEFSKRHLFVRRHKVHELIAARLKRESGHKKLPLPFRGSKMHGNLRQDSSRDCLGSVLDEVNHALLPDFNPVSFARFLIP